MTDLLQEFCDSRGVNLRLDREGGVIRGIKVLGLQSRNGREYLPDALSRAVGLYEGAKVNVNHPKGHPSAPRDYQERIGVIRNVQLQRGEGLFADFHFNPKHYLSEQLIWDAEHAPENVGFSHNVQARTSRQEETTVVEEILRVHSVDLVADPATTRGLFEASNAVTPSPSMEEGRREVAGAVEGVSSLPSAFIQNPQSDLFEQLCREQAGELARLRLEIDQLRAKEATEHRRSRMLTLLEEYGLPRPDSADASAKSIVSEAFLQAVLSAADETTMRRLIQERAQLIGTARRWLGNSRPMHHPPSSRDQLIFDPQTVIDSKSFARAITC